MSKNSAKPSILIIDDDPRLLHKLKDGVSRILPSDNVAICSWQPTTESSNDPFEEFRSHVDEKTVLVVTDYDLTSKGMKGLFGHTIVAWCQQLSIPVGNFSRANEGKLPTRPSLFELRVPSDNVKGPRFVASAFLGFKEIRYQISENPRTYKSKNNLASILATLLERPQLDSHFSLYISRLGTGNPALVDQLLKGRDGDTDLSQPDIIQMLSYVLGHILLNAILKFPGPILSGSALCAYMATSDVELETLRPLFENAIYKGPFGDERDFFWQEEVDKILEGFGRGVEFEKFESFGEYNRAVIKHQLGRDLARHDCTRCEGRKGGFLCPFTERTVCQDANCSVAVSGWVPQGAQLCRVWRAFFDEWDPMLGL